MADLSATPGPSSSSSEPVEGSIDLDTNGHCFICLKDPGESSMVIANPKDIQSFPSLLCYLTGFSHNGNLPPSNVFEGVLRMIKNTVPPLCVKCFDNLTKLSGWHQQFVELQRKIQEQTEVIRKSVAGTTDRSNGELDSQRDRFVESLKRSSNENDSNYLVLWVHKEIINQGAKPVKFPLQHAIPEEDENREEEMKTEQKEDNDTEEDLSDQQSQQQECKPEPESQMAATPTPPTAGQNPMKVCTFPSRFENTDHNLITNEQLLNNETWLEIRNTKSFTSTIVNWLRRRRMRLRNEIRSKADPTFIFVPNYRTIKSRINRVRREIEQRSNWRAQQGPPPNQYNEYNYNNFT